MFIYIAYIWANTKRVGVDCNTGQGHAHRQQADTRVFRQLNILCAGHVCPDGKIAQAARNGGSGEDERVPTSRYIPSLPPARSPTLTSFDPPKFVLSSKIHHQSEFSQSARLFPLQYVMRRMHTADLGFNRDPLSHLGPHRRPAQCLEHDQHSS